MISWLLLLACSPDPASTPVVVDDGEPVDLLAAIDPFIGSGGMAFQVGSGMPGATVPFGMVRLSPDTATHLGAYPGFHRGGGYHSDDTQLRAFSHTHLHGVGLTDYGAVGVIPVDGLQTSGGDWRTLEANRLPDFVSQAASPGSFEAVLTDPEVTVSLAASHRTGLHRYDFDGDVAEPTLLVDLGHALGSGDVVHSEIRWVDETHLEGWRRSFGEMADDYTVFFAAELDRAPVRGGTWSAGEPLAEDVEYDSNTWPDLDETPVPDEELEAEGAEAGAWATFAADEAGLTVGLRVAVSLVDQEGAWSNLEAEHTGFDVDAVASEASDAWASLLTPVRVWGGTEEQQVIFASSLYKSAIMPSSVEDADGRIMGFDAVAQDWDHPFLGDMSLWDTYRTTHPLYTLLWPDHHRDMLRSLAKMAETGGNLPKWPMTTYEGGFMVGSPAHIVGGEAWQKGLRDWDEEAFLEQALVESFGLEDPVYAGRPEPSYLDDPGWYPAEEIGRSVAWLQEVAVADRALAPMTEDLAEVEHSGPDATARLWERAENWRNVYDPEVGYFHARFADGTYDEFPSDSLWLDEYAEGNARQYLWMVPHDPEGLGEVLGGEVAMRERLDELFEETVDAEEDWAPGTPEPWYWHGNEPDISAAFNYVFTDTPGEATRWARWIMETRYSTEPEGLWGNDDGGTLSAWYVWAAMGLYPLAGTDRYVVIDPVFDKVEFDRPDGGVFTIVRLGDGELAEIRLDGETLETWVLTHDQLEGGGLLEVVGVDAL